MVAGLAYGAFAQERRCAEVPLENCRAVRVADRDHPPDLEVVVEGLLRQRYFRCPQCERLARALYDPEGSQRWRCRVCAKLDYRCRHETRDPLARAADLRRRLGAPLALGAPLPPRPVEARAAREHDRLAVEIAACEARALKTVRSMLDGLDRYATARGRPP